MAYEQLHDGERWEIDLDTDYQIACCACGLVHTTAVLPSKNKGKVNFVVVTNYRATAQHRRARSVRESIARVYAKVFKK